MLAPEHSRAARAWLGWSQDDLAGRAKVSNSTIRDFEAGKRTPIANNLEAMERAFADAGMRFTADAAGKPTGISVERDS